MPNHRRSERLPQRLIDKVKASDYSEFFGNVHFIHGKSLFRKPRDIQYTLKDHILTRSEFLRGVPSIPIHIAHFDPDTGKRFSTILD